MTMLIVHYKLHDEPRCYAVLLENLRLPKDTRSKAYRYLLGDAPPNYPVPATFSCDWCDWLDCEGKPTLIFACWNCNPIETIR